MKGRATLKTVSTAVVLIGHGAPATDCPPALIGELMSLQWRGNHASPAGDRNGSVQGRIAELDAKVRDWPRDSGNDPYKVGLERLAEALKPLLPSGLLAIGYNEFCRPSVSEAVEEVVRKGAARVLVIPSMLTPGGIHSEVDIPRALEEIRRRHPAVRIEYVWPFDLKKVAALLAAHVRAAKSWGEA